MLREIKREKKEGEEREPKKKLINRVTEKQGGLMHWCLCYSNKTTRRLAELIAE